MTAALDHYFREKISGLDPEKPLFSGLYMPGAASSETALNLTLNLEEMLRRTDTTSRRLTFSRGRRDPLPRSKAEQLFDALATVKIMTSKVAMHLSNKWRELVFRSLDELLHVDAWHDDDTILNTASFETFLRFTLFVHPDNQPHLGVSDAGNLLAGWIDGRNRLSLELLPQDSVRWVLVRYLDDERETAAAQVSLARIMEVLSPYEPERWLFDGNYRDS